MYSILFVYFTYSLSTIHFSKSIFSFSACVLKQSDFFLLHYWNKSNICCKQCTYDDKFERVRKYKNVMNNMAQAVLRDMEKAVWYFDVYSTTF